MERKRAAELSGMVEDTGNDVVPEITTRHFEAAMREARRSVSDADLRRYAMFAQGLQQARSALNPATGSSLSNFSFPGANAGAAGAATGAGAEEVRRLFIRTPLISNVHTLNHFQIFFLTHTTSSFHPTSHDAGPLRLVPALDFFS